MITISVPCGKAVSSTISITIIGDVIVCVCACMHVCVSFFVFVLFVVFVFCWYIESIQVCNLLSRFFLNSWQKWCGFEIAAPKTHWQRPSSYTSFHCWNIIVSLVYAGLHSSFKFAVVLSSPDMSVAFAMLFFTTWWPQTETENYQY